MGSRLTPENRRRFREAFQRLPDTTRQSLTEVLCDLASDSRAELAHFYTQLRSKIEERLARFCQIYGWKETLGAFVDEGGGPSGGEGAAAPWYGGEALIHMQEMVEEIAAGCDGYREATAGTGHGPRNQIWQIHGEIISVPDLDFILAEDRRLPLLRPRARSLLEHLVEHPESSWAEAGAAAVPPYPRASVREAFEDALRHGQRRKHNPVYQPKNAQAALASRSGPRLVGRQDHTDDHPPTAA